MGVRILKLQRRSLLKLGSVVTLSALGAPAIAKIAAPQGLVGRQIAMSHLHTAEKIGLVFAVLDRYVDPALVKLNHFLRDHYSNEVGVMDPALYDLMYRIKADLGVSQSYEVISGYRSPKTNDRLRKTRGGGVAKRSLHMQGKAIDIRLPGVPLKELRDAALAQKGGGVGYYPRDGFVHIDTGRVRSWG